ncbi:MAG: hypothetical protein NZ895_00180 [Archaeoglobaceae archaeon]|nr:hypothetical protein [Archaeoglobaceae archaeon]MCX8152344.1 hypothetical protein [Archaeoglobaceae archaeon]MDW8013628.1 hypothetical protein [Archaeoglobaceae archaeon]
MQVKYPCLVQLRSCKNLEKFAEKFGGKIVSVEKGGVDVYFEDVNDARRYISRIKKFAKVRIKMSIKQPKIFFYSVRCLDEDRSR